MSVEKSKSRGLILLGYPLSYSATGAAIFLRGDRGVLRLLAGSGRGHRAKGYDEVKVGDEKK